MKQQKRKGFTLVELLVVIAILAILATVSVVGYMSFIKKANISNDMALVKQINDLLLADETIDGKPATMQEALDVIEENGFLIENLTPTADGFDYVWDSENNRVVLLNENKEVVAPAGATLNKSSAFVIVRNSDEAIEWSEYALYLAKDFVLPEDQAELRVNGSVDVGECTTITAINYTNEGTAHNAIIRTNGGTLTIDAAQDTVRHYGTADNVNILAVADASYHEHGKVSVISIVKGRILVESTGEVKVVDASSATAVVKIESVTIDGIENIVVDNNSNVTVDSKLAQKEVEKTYVANHTELQESLDAGKKYIVFSQNIEHNAVISITKDVIIDGNGKELVATTGANRSIWIDASNVDVTIKNLTVQGNSISERGIQVNGVVTGITLNIDNCIISQISYYGINVCNDSEVNLTITNSTVEAWGALNLWSAEYQVRVSDSKLVGLNDKAFDAAGWNDFATVVLEGDTTNKTNDHSSMIDVMIINSEIVAKETTGNKQEAISFHAQTVANRVVLSNTKITLDEGNTYSYIDSGEGNELIIDGENVSLRPWTGKLSFDFSQLTYAEDGKSATGMVVINLDGKSYTIDLSEVKAEAWENGTDYLYDIELEKYLLRLDIDVSPEYGEAKVQVYLSGYIK